VASRGVLRGSHPGAGARGRESTAVGPIPVRPGHGHRQRDRGLSTPLAWAREEAAQAPKGRLVVAPDSGHSVQTRGGPAIRGALDRF
jgi:hypothetical protein